MGPYLIHGVQLVCTGFQVRCPYEGPIARIVDSCCWMNLFPDPWQDPRSRSTLGFYSLQFTIGVLEPRIGGSTWFG